MPKVSEIFLGGKDKTTQVPLQSPMQMELSQLISEGLKTGKGAFGDLFGNFNKEEFEKGVAQPEIKRFQQDVLPQLIHKFIGSGNTNSSSFRKALTRGGADLSSKLAELLYQAQQGQKQNQLAGLNLAQGTKQFENIFQPGQEGLVSKFTGGLGKGLGSAAGGGLNTAAEGVGSLAKAAANWIAG
jgi:hypothetical protein